MSRTDDPKHPELDLGDESEWDAALDAWDSFGEAGTKGDDEAKEPAAAAPAQPEALVEPAPPSARDAAGAEEGSAADAAVGAPEPTPGDDGAPAPLVDEPHAAPAGAPELGESSAPAEDAPAAEAVEIQSQASAVVCSSASEATPAPPPPPAGEPPTADGPPDEAARPADEHPANFDDAEASIGAADGASPEPDAAAKQVDASVEDAPPAPPRDPAAASWIERATRFEREAGAARRPADRARLLLVASEIWSTLGDSERAFALAGAAREQQPEHPLVHRALRAGALADGRWDDAARLLEAEALTGTGGELEAHAARLGAEIARFALGDEARARSLDERAARAVGDARGHLSAAVAALADGVAPAGELGALAGTVAVALDARAPADAARATSGAETRRLVDVRGALAARDPRRAISALASLFAVPGLGNAAAWLAAAVAANDPSSKRDAAAILRGLEAGPHGRLARRWLAARAIELGDAELAATLATDVGSRHALDVVDRVAVATLAGCGAETLAGPLADAAKLPAGRALAAGVGAALAPAEARTDAARDLARPEAFAPLALGRALGARADDAAVATLATAAGSTSRDAPFASVLALEADFAAGRATEVAAALARLATSTDDAALRARDRAIAAAIAFDCAGDRAGARRAWAEASISGRRLEATARAAVDEDDDETTAGALEAAAAHAASADAAAMLLVEAALRVAERDAESARRRLAKAAELSSTSTLASVAAELLAGRSRSRDAALASIAARRASTSDTGRDPVELALDLVVEARLVSGDDAPRAAALLDRALALRPGDLGLREIVERLAPPTPGEAALARVELASKSRSLARACLAHDAALTLEAAGDAEAAARAASLARDANVSRLADVTAERLAISTGRAPELFDRLMLDAQKSDDPAVRRAAAERLADIDVVVRGDVTGAAVWSAALVEEDPAHLPGLHHLERVAVGEGRDEEIENVAVQLAAALSGADGLAYAALARRLRAAHDPAGAREIAADAARGVDAPLWALRALTSTAASESADGATSRALLALVERTSQPLEVATLVLRAAEHAERAGDAESAAALAERAAASVPEHLVAHETIARVALARDDAARAATALEVVATLTTSSERRIDATYDAGVLWAERVGDAVRARAALERVAAADLSRGRAFEILRTIYVAAGDAEAEAGLLARRIASVDDARERAALEVARARALLRLGREVESLAAAEAALVSDADDAEASTIVAELAEKLGDAPRAERAWQKLADLATTPAARVGAWRRLAALYGGALEAPEKAERAWEEVLLRAPNDDAALTALVALRAQRGDVERAIATQHTLVALAPEAGAKVARTIELARLYEAFAGDPRLAEATLEAARRDHPTDVSLLAALASLLRRQRQTAALDVLVDRTISDARRALATGRFDPSIFALLATALRLRDRADEAAVAESTAAAIEGRFVEVPGIGLAAIDAANDDALAPELVTPALRQLLAKAGAILERAYPVDVSAIGAVPLGDDASHLRREIDALAAAFGLRGLETLVSPKLGLMVVPCRTSPPQIVVGAALATTADAAARTFLLLRALELVRVHGSVVARTSPMDLVPMLSAWLKTFVPSWKPSAVDPTKLDEALARVARAAPEDLGDDEKALAVEVIGTIGNKASALRLAIESWASRIALLATGDTMAALRAIAWAGGQPAGPPVTGPERARWVARNQEARDLLVFSVGATYADVRRASSAD